MPPGQLPKHKSDLVFLCRKALLLCLLILFIWVDEAYFLLYRRQQGPLISGDENITLMVLLFRGRREVGVSGEEMEEEEKGGREINTESARLEQEPLCLSDPPRITLAMPQPLILGLKSMFGTQSASWPHELLFVCLDPGISVV